MHIQTRANWPVRWPVTTANTLSVCARAKYTIITPIHYKHPYIARYQKIKSYVSFARYWRLWLVISLVSSRVSVPVTTANTARVYMCKSEIHYGYTPTLFDILSKDKIIRLFCKRALPKRRYSAKETYNFKEPTNRSDKRDHKSRMHTRRFILIDPI